MGSSKEDPNMEAVADYRDGSKRFRLHLDIILDDDSYDRVVAAMESGSRSDAASVLKAATEERFHGIIESFMGSS